MRASGLVAFVRACYMTDQRLSCPWRVHEQGILLRIVCTGFTEPSLLFSIFSLGASIPLYYKHFTYPFNIPMHFFPKPFCSRTSDVHVFLFCEASTLFRVTASPYRASWTNSWDTPPSVGLLWTSDQLDAGTSTWQHATPTWYKHPCHRGDSKPRSQQASGRRLTP
jgi:hypothetical protein